MGKGLLLALCLAGLLQQASAQSTWTCGLCTFSVMNGTLTRDVAMCDGGQTCTYITLTGISSFGTALAGGGLASLEALYLDNNAISVLEPGVFSDLPVLQTLSLVGNNISTLQAGSFPSSIRFISLDSNKIATVEPGAFSDLPNLETVSLSSNNITALSASVFSDLPKLANIYLDDNQIQTIHRDAFLNLPALLMIKIRNNHLGSIAKWTFSDMPSLQQVFLTNSMIHAIEGEAFYNLPQLTHIHLTNNGDLLAPPIDFFSYESLLPSLQQVDMVSTGIGCIPPAAWNGATVHVHVVPTVPSCTVPCSIAAHYFKVTAYDSMTGSCMWNCTDGYVEETHTSGTLCLPTVEGEQYVSASEARAAHYCSPACRGESVSDGICDPACVTPSCGWDLTDCWTSSAIANIRATPAYALTPATAGSKVYLSDAFQAAMWLLNEADSNMDRVVDIGEASSVLGMTDQQYAELGGGYVTGIAKLLTGFLAAVDGVAEYEGNVMAASEALIKLTDQAHPLTRTKDGMLSPLEATRLGFSTMRFDALDADKSGLVTAMELASSTEDPCHFASFSAAPPSGAQSGSFKFKADKLFLGSARTCSYMVQPKWFYPTDFEPEGYSGVDATVTMYASANTGTTRDVICLGAFVHSKWVLTSAACSGARFAQIGQSEYEVAKFVKHPGSAQLGFDVALVELAGIGARDNELKPVKVQIGDEVMYRKECSQGFLTSPSGSAPGAANSSNTSNVTVWEESYASFDSSSDTPAGFFEGAVSLSTFAECDTAHHLASGDDFSDDAANRVVCAAPSTPCDATGNMVPPVPGTPLFLRTSRDDFYPKLVGIASSIGQVTAKCGYQPPAVYTMVPTVQQWVRSVSSDLGVHAPKGISVDFKTVNLPLGASITVREAHAGMQEGNVLDVVGGSPECAMTGISALGKGSVIVDVTMSPVAQTAECVSSGEGCVGVEVEAEWEETGCGNFSTRMCDVDGCIKAEPMAGAMMAAPACLDPVCTIGVPVWGKEMQSLRKDHRLVMGGLGNLRSDTYPTAKTYACVRDWNAEAERLCAAREGEFVCFKHLEEDNEMVPMGGVGKNKVVLPKKEAEVIALHRKKENLHSIADAFHDILEARGVDMAWWSMAEAPKP